MNRIDDLLKKSFNKKTLTGLFLFFTCFVLNAQISGTAVNEKKEPVAFATVILKTAQDSSVTGCYI